MKTIYITTLMITALCMLVFPLFSGGAGVSDTAAALPAANTNITVPETEQVRVLCSADNTVREYSLEDYLFGVVAAEMPALYEEEALKAQTVAAYTFLLRRTQASAGEEHDITDDYTVDQAFITAGAAREKWGDGADEYENKIRSAVRSVMGQKVTYGGELAATVYHAISGGTTEKAADIWGGDYPYLVAVDSSWDKLAENYLASVSFTADELNEKLANYAQIEDAGTNCFSELTRSDSGSVLKLKVSGTEMTGNELRAALELRSADFDIDFSDGTYTFTTRGYGHGIGMSQYGAHYMAMQGKTYKEILLHYYPGCKIE